MTQRTETTPEDVLRSMHFTASSRKAGLPAEAGMRKYAGNTASGKQ